MGFVEWFKERRRETQRLKADALHMREQYGASALDMCEFAIASAQDGGLRHQLRVIRRMLLAQNRMGARAHHPGP